MCWKPVVKIIPTHYLSSHPADWFTVNLFSNPVSESHLLRPESIYAIHKLATENYYQLYHQLYGLNSIIFRISNPFGPYQRFGSNNYGVLNWFIHKALTNEPIDLYGDGQQQRDFLYIDDLTGSLHKPYMNRSCSATFIMLVMERAYP